MVRINNRNQTEYIICPECGTSREKYYRRKDGRVRWDVARKFCSKKCLCIFNNRRYIDYSYKKRRTLGYIKIVSKNHHRRDNNDCVFEHILVYEKTYSCCLLEWSSVHHLNGKKDDNRPENLEAMMKYRHSKLHARDRNKIFAIINRFSWDRLIN